MEHTKHPKYYYEDGNTLILVENTIYNLHKSRLSEMSGGLRAQFKRLDTGSNDGESFMLDLGAFDVTSKDLDVLLEALDHAMYVEGHSYPSQLTKPFPRRKFTYSKPTFATVASIFRASIALGFDDFESWAARYLEDMWPCTLEQINTASKPFAAETVVLARRCQVPSVLKQPLYELVRLEGFGQPADGGSQDSRTAARKMLSPDDIALLLRTREKLSSLWLTMATVPLNDLGTCDTVVPHYSGDVQVKQENITMSAIPRSSNPTQQCTAANPDRALKSHTRLVHDSGVFKKYLYDPLCGFQALADARWSEEGFCEQCIMKRRARWLEERQKLWNDLDTWFDLPGV